MNLIFEDLKDLETIHLILPLFRAEDRCGHLPILCGFGPVQCFDRQALSDDILYSWKGWCEVNVANEDAMRGLNRSEAEDEPEIEIKMKLA